MAEPIKKNKGGRPKGSKTRPDAPSKLKKLHAQRDAKGHFIPAVPPSPVSPATPPSPVSPATPPPPPPPPAAVTPDSSIFGTVPDFDNPPPGALPPEAETPAGGPTPDPAAGGPAPEPEAAPVEPEATAESHRPLALTLFNTIVALLASIMGEFWYPRKVGHDHANGEIPFDEGEMVVTAICEYFQTLGMAVLTPAQKLWLAILAYTTPRLGFIINWCKTQFFKRKTKPVQTGPDPRTPDAPPVNP